MNNNKSEKEKSPNRLKWVFRNLKLESQYGKNALSEIKAYKNSEKPELEKCFSELNNIVSVFKIQKDLFGKFNNYFMELRNIAGSVKNLSADQTLNETELFEIKNFSILVTDIIELAAKENILSDSLKKLDLKPVINLLNPDKIVTRSFYIHENWSEKLKDIRESKKQIETEIIAEKDSLKKEELRAKRGEIVALEHEEELAVRKELTQKLKTFEKNLEFAINNIGNYELTLAKAEMAVKNNCCIPDLYDFNPENQILIEEAIEPEIAETLQANQRTFTPVSIEIKKGVTLLTGANMGGKSVALRTIALNVELVRFGFLPFAKKMSLFIPDFVKVISGDLQDAKEGLSSFGAEIVELTELLNMLDTGNGLAVCDELARSTNPYEGSRFVQALSDRLQSSSSYGIIATHYDGIKTEGASYYQVTGLKALLENGSDLKSINDCDLYKLMDYHLIKSANASIVPHEALRISMLLGLPESFVEKLKKYY